MFYTFCTHHGKEEICPSEPYKVCSECRHIFQTEEGLLVAYTETMETPILSHESITACPFCSTDF